MMWMTFTESLSESVSSGSEEWRDGAMALGGKEI